MYPGKPVRAGERDGGVVREIQTALKAAGIGRGGEGGALGVDGDFGPDTQAAVRLFQARSVDERDDPLEVDGVVGPHTWAALFRDQVRAVVAAPGSYLASVLEIAVHEVGVLEVPRGSNDGPRVRQFLQAAGCSAGDPWCASFVYWCFKTASEAAGAPANPAPRTGGVHEMWRRAGTANLWRATPSQANADPEIVKPGQLFFLDTGNGHGHVGFITEVRGTLLTTIEGNTNDGGSREGIGVFRRNSRRVPGISLGFADFTRPKGA